MRELSVFVDESGTQDGSTPYYIITYLLHDQSDDVSQAIRAYEKSLSDRSLPNIPFHATPLMRAHDAYKNYSIADRKKLLVSFNVLVQRLPVRYKSFAYRSKDYSSPSKLEALVKRDLASLLADSLEYFQSFDKVKIYYDNGQAVVARALKAAFDYSLSKEAVVERRSDYRNYRLAQVADYLCAIELAALKYSSGNETATDIIFFGGSGSFKKQWLKQARRKLLNA